jgi:hypothetical protein
MQENLIFYFQYEYVLVIAQLNYVFFFRLLHLDGTYLGELGKALEQHPQPRCTHDFRMRIPLTTHSPQQTSPPDL